MSIFDKLKKGAAEAVKNAAQSFGNKSETFTFNALPESLAEMKALPEAELTSPYQTAALTLCALCAYAADKNVGTEMLNFLRGPRPLSGMDISFLKSYKIPVLVQAPGGFFVYGVMIAVMNRITAKNGGVKRKSFSCAGCPSSAHCNQSSCGADTDCSVSAENNEAKEA